MSRPPPAPTGTLCDVCSKIPFDSEDPPAQRGGKGWSLGTLDQIRKKTECPSCRLVARAAYEIQRGWLPLSSQQQEIFLEWGMYTFLSAGFHLEWSGARGNGTSIRYVNRLPEGQSTSFRDFSLMPNIEQKLDIQRVQSWIRACQRHHDSCMNRAFFNLEIEVLRLIDVRRGCIVEFRGQDISTRRYLILSYVWGGINSVRLTSSTKADLMTDGAIDRIWDILPRTIQDAIELVKALEEHYLWVDALCMVQNDASDMQGGIEVMDIIYEQAALCIIAASGDSANAGLPGIREGTRLVSHQVEELRPGTKMAVYNELDHMLRPSTYNRRAWTFQEQYLSRRALYFTNDQVYFRCRESTWSENCIDGLPVPNNGEFLSTLLPEAWKAEPETEYRTMLLYFTRRALTNQADALLAMAGLCRRISSKMRSRFFQGLPTALFDTFVIFESHGELLRRRQGFPSYSWCGWIGPVDIYDPMEENAWLRERTWIVWYKRSPSGTINLVWDIEANENFPVADLNFVGYRKRHPFGNRHMLQFPTSRTTPTQDHHFDKPLPSYPLLQFWTLAVYFTISNVQVFHGLASIRDRSGTSCGHLSMDGFGESTFFEASGPFEFIILSEREIDHIQKRWDNGDANYTGTIWKYYNVLLIEWNSGIAERRGLGVIYQSAVEKTFSPGPVWKEIFLA